MVNVSSMGILRLVRICIHRPVDTHTYIQPKSMQTLGQSLVVYPRQKNLIDSSGKLFHHGDIS